MEEWSCLCNLKWATRYELWGVKNQYWCQLNVESQIQTTEWPRTSVLRQKVWKSGGGDCSVPRFERPTYEEFNTPSTKKKETPSWRRRWKLEALYENHIDHADTLYSISPRYRTTAPSGTEPYFAILIKGFADVNWQSRLFILSLCVPPWNILKECDISEKSYQQ